MRGKYRRKQYIRLITQVLDENPLGLTAKGIVSHIKDVPVKTHPSYTSKRLWVPTRAQVSSLLRTKIKVIVVERTRNLKVYALPKFAHVIELRREALVEVEQTA